VVSGSAHKAKLEDHTHRLARWLGVLHRVGSDMSYRLITESGKIISKCLMSYANHDDYLQADRRKEVEDFNRQNEASLDDANFINDGRGEFDNLHLRNMNNDLNSGVRCKNNETTPNPGLRGHESRRNTNCCQRRHYNIRQRRSGDMSWRRHYNIR
jgi:hypothetical protein